MRYLSLLFLLTLCCSCGSSDAQTAADPAPAPALTEVTSPAPTKDPIESPCETFTNETVATTFGWASGTEGQPNSMREGQVQNCYFSARDDAGFVNITISQSDARTIERKYLERAFTKDLAREDDLLVFEEVNVGLGDQAIYTTGKKGPHHLYQLRWRKGNEVDYDITLRTSRKQNKAAIFEKLKSLATRL
jgi:hypothetical protein